MTYPNETGWRVVAAAMVAYAHTVADEVVESVRSVDQRINALVGLELTVDGWTWQGVVINNGDPRRPDEIKPANREAIDEALARCLPHPSVYGALNSVIASHEGDFFRFPAAPEPEEGDEE